MMTLVDDEAQEPFEIVHIYSLVPMVNPETSVPLSVSSTKVPLPATTVQTPVPTAEVLPPKVARSTVSQTVWPSPASDVVGVASTVIIKEVSSEQVPEHITNALTRDYSGLMKALDKKGK